MGLDTFVEAQAFSFYTTPMNTYIPRQNNHLPEIQTPVVQVNRVNHSLVKNVASSKVEYDDVINESPLQISLCWQDENTFQERTQVFTITMRTPVNDIELAMGLLFTEGQITDKAQIASIDCEENEDGPLINQLMVKFKPGFAPNLTDLQRQLISQSSCGICGKTSLKSLEIKVHRDLDNSTDWLDASQLCQLPDRLNQHQPLFSLTGGVHGAALYDEHYQLITVQEDIGRHNAVDKVIGDQLMKKPLGGKQILLVSGRVSFELVQKAVVAGYPVLVSVGAPSSLAISAAQRFDLTLIGFVKEKRFNVYHGQWRIKSS